MKSLEALKNINYKDVIVRALWTFLRRRLSHYLLLSVTSQLISRRAGTNYTLPTLATALSATRLDYLRLRIIILDLVRQMKEAAE